MKTRDGFAVAYIGWPLLGAVAVADHLRPFRLMSDWEAARLLHSGFSDPEEVPEAQLLARDLADAVNSALLSIRRALLNSGRYTEADAPLLAISAVRHVGEAAATKLAQQGFAGTARVWKLAVLGEPCGGKTKCRKFTRPTLEQMDSTIRMFSTREVATVLYQHGAMNGGSFQPLVQKEYREYVLQSEILQLAFEGIWARGAAVVVGRPGKQGRAIDR